MLLVLATCVLLSLASSNILASQQPMDRMATLELRVAALESQRVAEDIEDRLEQGAKAAEAVIQLRAELLEKLARIEASGEQQSRRLSDEGDSSRATLQIDAPNGVSEIIMGGEAAADSIIIQKSSEADGSNFTLSRNETTVLSVETDGSLHVHSSPLKVASRVRAMEGKLALEGRGGVTMQGSETLRINELDGQGKWSQQTIRIQVGDSVEWVWTNYHNVIETDAGSSIKSAGISSGLPTLRDTFLYRFNSAGIYYFKSQTQFSMICTVDVRESFSLQGGTLTIGGDLELGGEVRADDIKVAKFAAEIKMFLANECPGGWVEATELGGYFLMGRPAGGQVNVSKNRPMDVGEEGRMHSTYYKGDASIQDKAYDDRYMGGYYGWDGASKDGS
ncbi:MAG: hypothetical protein SGPRY_013917, partial [Prymnesium sp.]